MSIADEWLQRGHEYRRHCDWQHAIECYNQALAIEPQGAAREALDMVMHILEFGNKQIYNV